MSEILSPADSLSTEDFLTERHAEMLGADLQIEVGRVWLSLKEILDLCPGKVIDLNLPSPLELTLCCAEEIIAKAILARSGDSLVLQITEAFDEKSTQQNSLDNENNSRTCLPRTLTEPTGEPIGSRK